MCYIKYRRYTNYIYKAHRIFSVNYHIKTSSIISVIFVIELDGD